MALVTPGLDAIELRIPTADDASVAERNAEWNQGQPATYTWMELEGSDPGTEPPVADD